MKTKYEVKRIDWKKIITLEDYEKALRDGESTICYGLKEVFAYCGGKLKRERFGYNGMINTIEYIATRV